MKLVVCYSRPNRHGFFSQGVCHALNEHGDRTLCGRTPHYTDTTKRDAGSTNWVHEWRGGEPTCNRCRKALGLPTGYSDPRDY